MESKKRGRDESIESHKRRKSSHHKSHYSDSESSDDKFSKKSKKRDDSSEYSKASKHHHKSSHRHRKSTHHSDTSSSDSYDKKSSKKSEKKKYSKDHSHSKSKHKRESNTKFSSESSEYEKSTKPSEKKERKDILSTSTFSLTPEEYKMLHCNDLPESDSNTKVTILWGWQDPTNLNNGKDGWYDFDIITSSKLEKSLTEQMSGHIFNDKRYADFKKMELQLRVEPKKFFKLRRTVRKIERVKDSDKGMDTAKKEEQVAINESEQTLKREIESLKEKYELLEKEDKDYRNSIKQKFSCFKCTENVLNCMCLPCRHLSLCLECARDLRTCPICSETIEHIQKIEIPI